MNTVREIKEIMKGKYTFETYAKETDLGKFICYAAPHLPNEIVTKILQLTTKFKITEDQVEDNASHNRNLLISSSDEEESSNEEKSSEMVFIPGEFIENQKEWGDVKFGTETMAYSGCELYLYIMRSLRWETK